jgi:putative MFS transporter
MTARTALQQNGYAHSGSVGPRLDRLPSTRWLKGVMALLFLSWFIESYDIGLTGSVLPSWTHLYHLSAGGKSLAAIAANIGIVAGIVPAGWLADRFGRRTVLVGGTLAYAVLTFCTGLASGIAGVLSLRVLAGLAMGAVFPLPYVIGTELTPADRRGRFTGLADSFLSVGYFISPLLAVALIPTVADTTGWRIMFFIGGLPVVFALLAWRYLPESPRWYESKGRLGDADRVVSVMEANARRETGASLAPVVEPPAGDVPPAGAAPAGAASALPARAGLRTIFSPAYLRRSVTLWIAFGGTFFVFYSIQTFMPTVIHDKGFALTSAFGFTAVIVAISIPGKLLEAWVVERWGRKPVIIVFAGVAAVASIAFGFAHGALPVLLLGAVMSFFGIGVDPAVKVYTAESYPTEIRSWGTATTEGFGRLLSGVIGPAFIPVLLAAAGVAAVYTLVGAVALVAVATVAWGGRETRRIPLEQLAAEARSATPAA